MTNLYYIYIIENPMNQRWYIGFSTNVNRRLKEHNSKEGSNFTRNAKGLWKLIYLEGYCNKIDALGREKYLKSGAGRRYIKKQLKIHISKL